MLLRRVAHILAVALALAAAVISNQLLSKHVGKSAGAGWFEAGCSDNPAPGTANCAAVLASPYSYFPPKTNDPADRRARLPVAFLGLAYYSALAVWLIGIGRPAPQRRWLHAAPLVLVGMGLAACAYFSYIMFRRLDQWCPWCMVTHGLNVLIAICVVAMWPGRPKRPAEPAIAATPMAVPHPSMRLVGVTGMAVLAVVLGELSLLGLKSWKRQAQAASDSYNSCVDVVKRFRADAEMLFRTWPGGRVREVALRADDPVRVGASAKAGQATFDVMVFSDFECPSCARFAAFVEEQSQPLFDGHLKLTFKHYPIDKACNSRASQTMHPHACEGAALVEAARALGGSDAFWRAHDYVYKHRDVLAAGKIAPQAVASAIGLDPGALAIAMQSEQIGARIAEDVEQAKLADIRGTPAVFVDGKLVDTIAVTEVGFRDKLADMYWQRVGAPRPASTKPKPAATPSTPERKDGP